MQWPLLSGLSLFESMCVPNDIIIILIHNIIKNNYHLFWFTQIVLLIYCGPSMNIHENAALAMLLWLQLSSATIIQLYIITTIFLFLLCSTILLLAHSFDVIYIYTSICDVITKFPIKNVFSGWNQENQKRQCECQLIMYKIFMYQKTVKVFRDRRLRYNYSDNNYKQWWQ